MRLHELAKEYNLQSKDLLEKVQDLRDANKTASSSLTVDQIKQTRLIMGPPPGSTPAAPPVVETPPAPVAPPPPVAAAPVEPPKPAVPEKRVVTIKNPIIVREFAESLGLKPNQVITDLMRMNVFASINQKIDLKIAQQIAARHNATVEFEKKAPPPKPEVKAAPPKPAPEPIQLKNRAPVVTFMGHVDHGKTSLLDKIRNAKVAAGEAGGITQHIGAYTITVNNKKITFLDTPGHEAFTAMRARGATITDIVVLVVDGVDGIMPQTKEAVQHAKAANVTLMVAVNKMDLRAANLDRVKQQLQQLGLSPEDWGGETVVCPVSAITGAGVDQLLEMILLQAEVLELKATDRGPAKGYVIEAQRESGRGPTATLLIRNGSLNVGDPVLCGPYWGRVKALIDYKGEKVKSAGPSDAVKCLGLSEVPEAGWEFEVCASDREARDISEARLAEQRERDLSDSSQKRISLEYLLKPTVGPEKKELNIVLKADTQGSLEAIQHALGGIKSEKVTLKIIYTGIGTITANDALLARASSAIIVGFNVSKEPSVGSVAKRESVEIRLYTIIYELIDELRDAMLGLLDPVIRENVIGHAEVRQVFDLSKRGSVAGCIVTDGRVTSRSRARVRRKGEVLFVGNVGSLKRFQNDASEVREGQECGIRVDNFGSFQPGDIIELYEVEKIAQQL